MTGPDATALDRLLMARSVRRGHFRLASGRTSAFYIDARLTTMSSEGLNLIGRLGLAAIRGQGWAPRAVGGLTLGADPVAYAVAAASAISGPAVDAFTVRKEVKGHGMGRRVEGNFQPGDEVVVVEDVVTSGESALQATEVLRNEGGQVLGIMAVVDREEGGLMALRAKGLQVVVLTTATRLGLTQE